MPRILYEDDNIIFCIKEAGLLSESGEGSVVTLLETHTGGSIYPVHRLDRGVGGVMAYAKTQKAATFLSEQIQNGSFIKEYLAVTRGAPAEESGVLTDLLFHDRRLNKSFAVTKKRSGVKSASLEYRLLGTRENQKGRLSLVHVRLHTGRTHQIRVQFSSRRLPLYGDGKYGGRTEKEGIALWSHRITLFLPFSSERVTIEARPEGKPWTFFEF